MGNSEGQPRPDCYLEFEVSSFPTESNNNRGNARYVSPNREPASFRFQFDSAREVFIGWLAVQSGELKRFEMAPVCVGDLIIGLNVKFSHEGTFIVHFALQEEEDLYPSCQFAELTGVTF